MELDKLDKVAMLARKKESAAAQQLAQQQDALRTSSSRLEQLESFRSEYEARLQAVARSGMDARQLADYRRFLSGLSEAITVQSDEVGREEQRVAEQRETFRDQSLRRSNVDELIGRSRAALAADEARREQRAADESTLARYPRE